MILAGLSSWTAHRAPEGTSPGACFTDKQSVQVSWPLAAPGAQRAQTGRPHCGQWPTVGAPGWVWQAGAPSGAASETGASPRESGSTSAIGSARRGVLTGAGRRAPQDGQTSAPGSNRMPQSSQNIG
jgi:hypothetical protein